MGLGSVLAAVARVDLDAYDGRLVGDEGIGGLSLSAEPSIVYTNQTIDDANTACSRHQWNVPALRTNQRLACRHLGDPSRPKTLLLIDRTGGGKTHVTRVVGCVERGVVLIIVPLLALSADQLAKFKEGSQAYGTVEAHHMDELVKESRAKVFALMRRINLLERDTTSTIFVICSPQFLVHNSNFCSTIIKASSERILRLVVIDEVHLYVQHGSISALTSVD